LFKSGIIIAQLVDFVKDILGSLQEISIPKICGKNGGYPIDTV